MRDYRVLIIDDDAIDRRHYCKLLEQLEPDVCHVKLAPDGTSGLAALRADSFDCVLPDFDLPGMNGLEFLTAAAVDGTAMCSRGDNRPRQ
jgi:CheY-like chemotaxis protein